MGDVVTVIGKGADGRLLWERVTICPPALAHGALIWFASVGDNAVGLGDGNTMRRSPFTSPMEDNG